MKQLLVLLSLALMVTAGANAQYGSTRIFNDETYSGTSADTSGTYAIGPFDHIILTLEFSDSNNVAVYVDYKVAGSLWETYTAVDSTNDAVAAGGITSKVIRLFATDNIPGATSYRVRVAGIAASGKNSANSGATFDAWVFRKFY